MSFWVIGGEYESTQFDHLKNDRREERYGPFADYSDAMREWTGRSWRRVDECLCRYRIVDDEVTA